MLASIWKDWIDPLTGNPYAFWSGVGSGSPLFVLAAGYLHHKNCVERGCWRIGHPDPQHGHPSCRRHSSHFRNGKAIPEPIEPSYRSKKGSA